MFLYIGILILKILENILSTYRIIKVAQKEKITAAILQAVITFFWIASTSLVIVDIKDEPIKILFLVIGAFIGSYIGSLIEEKRQK